MKTWKSTSGSGGSFAEVPIGEHRARIYELEDLGIFEHAVFGSSRALMWKFQTEIPITAEMFPDGEVNEEAIGKRLGASGLTNLNLDGSPKLNPGYKGQPSKDYEWCMGLGLSPEKLAEGIDPETDIIGKTCYIYVELKKDRHTVTKLRTSPDMGVVELKRDDLRRDPGYYIREKEQNGNGSFDYGANAGVPAGAE